MKCLYSEISKNCSDRGSQEHLLQAALGGTLTSDKVICETCNQIFGNEIDNDLRDFYLKIILTIAPSLPSGNREKKVKFRQPDGVWLEVNSGNQLTFSGLKFLPTQNAVISQPDYDEKTVEAIFKAKHGKVGDIRLKEIPISDLYPTITFPPKKYFSAYRAAVKSSLNLLNHFDNAGKLPAKLNYKALMPAISFVFTDKDNLYFGPHITPFIDFREKFGLDAPSDRVGHSFVVSHDSKANKTYVLLQIFSSFCWYFEADELFSAVEDFSLLYKKDFLPEKKDDVTVLKSAVVTQKEIRDGKFVMWSKAAVKFSMLQFENSLEEIHGLCTYYADLNYADVVKETIRVMDLKHVSDDKNFELTFLDLVGNRYSGHFLIEEIIEFSRTSIGETQLDSYDAIYTFYAAILPQLRSKFGLPITYIERSTGL